MRSLFDNLFLYEIVLLFLGVFLFMLLCVGFVYFIIRKDDLKKLLWFFPIPIIMIAFSSIQEIRIEKDKIALKKFTQEVIEHPEDTATKQKLIKIAEKLEKRAKDIEDIKAIAEANLVLGNSEKIIDLTNKIIEEESQAIQEETPEDSIRHIEINRGANNKLVAIKGINEVAKMQIDVKDHLISSKDTSRLKEQINRIPWSDPKKKNI